MTSRWVATWLRFLRFRPTTAGTSGVSNSNFSMETLHEFASGTTRVSTFTTSIDPMLPGTEGRP